MDKKLTLPDFLKLLTGSNIPIAKAMAVASIVFKEYNSPALLAQLDDARLQVLGIKDKDLRRLVLAAVRRAGYTGPTRKPEPESDNRARPVTVPSSNKNPATVQTPITPKKKRRRDDGSNEFLPEAPDEASRYGSMDFNDVLDEEVLKVKSTVVNRAPLMIIWATIIAERLGFGREEALSIGSVYTEMNAVAKGVSLGIMDQSREKEFGPIPGGRQPYVDLMGKRILLYQTQLSKWRALVNGSPVAPSTAFSYVSCAFRQTAPYIVGALRLLAESYTPQELNNVGFSLYADFRPKVDGWGKRGEVRCEHILSLRKNGSGEASGTRASNAQCDNQELIPELSAEHLSKKARKFSIGEREVALDKDFELGKE